MPRSDGLEATRRICPDPELEHARVVVLSMFALEECVHDAESLFAPSVLTRLVESDLNAAPGQQAGRQPSEYRLTGRESEVLVLVAKGLSNDEIAARLHLAVRTAKRCVSHLLGKASGRDRAQLAVTAYDAGLVQPRTDQKGGRR
ncbi:LuxR C-terminal-related transcriptional regulator [Streptomyces sp. NBC_01754]|uniref:helix-turn-helix transcriptional regulator n=1 Tax=Streptomyces sp. NBC_01754 TaxID=2975930 RepID=UPI002DD7AFA5|nr:LuxR C-terminal-related transcriptional regulator [Streptomyces sp. NBC_01754]WSC94617.1 LuxR C-terminal-related transcriptional regulator [Streptomyces sp. NBC_01754]